MIAYRYTLPDRYYAGAVQDGGLLPANATYEAPPAVPEGYVARWTGESWDLIEDHRGAKYWLPEDSWEHDGREMRTPGPLPAGATLTRPEMPEAVRLERAAQAVRAERDRRLAATDYLIMPDYPIGEGQRADWEAYRQALRDMPQAEGFPWAGVGSVPWPEEPEC